MIQMSREAENHERKKRMDGNGIEKGDNVVEAERLKK